MLSTLSYREKSLYASLIAELAVYGPYFLFHRRNSVDNVAGMIVGIIILQIVLQSLIAAFTRNRTTDERDKLVELRGYRAGYLMSVTLMVLGLVMIWFHSITGRANFEGTWVGLHFLSAFFGILVVSDITKTVTQIVAYRRAL